MKTKYLKEIGLSTDQIKKVMAENGKDIQKYKKENEFYKIYIKNNNKKIIENENIILEYKDKILELEYDLLLSKYIESLKLKNDIYIEAIKNKIKESNLKFEYGKLIGGEEIIKEFKSKYPEAFLENVITMII